MTQTLVSAAQLVLCPHIAAHKLRQAPAAEDTKRVPKSRGRGFPFDSHYGYGCAKGLVSSAFGGGGGGTLGVLGNKQDT